MLYPNKKCINHTENDHKMPFSVLSIQFSVWIQHGYFTKHGFDLHKRTETKQVY